MDWDELLNSLCKGFLAGRVSAGLEQHIHELLSAHATTDWLRSFSVVLREGQVDQARDLVRTLLRDYPDPTSVRKGLEAIALFERRKSSQIAARNVRNREQFRQQINFMVKSGKFYAAKDLLEEALREDEDPALLDLLSRVCMLQRDPQQAATAMRRALLVRRQQDSFGEEPPLNQYASPVEHEVVNAADLDYIATETKDLVGLLTSSGLQSKIPEAVESSPHADHAMRSDQETDLNCGRFLLISPNSALLAEASRHIAPKKKTLTLAGARKPQYLALTPQGTRIRVSHAPRRESELRASSIVTEVSPPSAVPPSNWIPQVAEMKMPLEQPCLEKDGGFKSRKTKELICDENHDDPDEFACLSEESHSAQLDSYEPEDRFFDSDELLVDQVDVADYTTFEGLNDEEIIDDEYFAYVFDPDDVYESLADFDSVSEELNGMVSREERALQKSVELVSKIGWSIEILPIVQQIFVTNGWGTARLALEQEIEKGMTPKELILATQVRTLWAENDYYWTVFDKTGSSSLSQNVLSWPTALLLVRAFGSLPQIEEIEQFVESLFAFWYERPHLRRAFRSFRRFMWFRVSNVNGCLPADQPFSFCNPSELPSEEFSDLGMSDLAGVERIAKLRAFFDFKNAKNY